MLGTFEQYVLQAVMQQAGNGYGTTLLEAVSAMSGRDVSVGALYTTLARLEAKKFVKSRIGEATAERGGRAKKYFTIQAPGVRALKDAEAAALRIFALKPMGA